MKQSISASQGRVAQLHDERVHYPDNAREDMKQYNRTIVKQDCSYHEAFNSLFADSVEQYNSKQTRNDRKITDYYDSLMESDRKEKPIYEYVFQIGNHESNSVLSDTKESMLCREALDSAMDKLQDKYSAFHFMFIGSHGDEPGGTYHYHVAFTPVGCNYKNGMQERCSLTKALASMGFKSSQNDGYAITQWQNDVKDLIEAEMLQRGIERAYMGNTDKHLSVSQFKRMKANAELDESIAFMKDYEHRLNEQSVELEKREYRLSKRESDINAHETRLNALEGVLRAKEQALALREQEMALKASQLAQKEQDMDALIDSKVKMKLRIAERRREQVASMQPTETQHYRGEDVFTL